MKRKKIPQRMCISCKQRFPKRDLIRIVKTPENELLVDLTGKKSGRGAYICKNKECLHILNKKNLIKQHLGIDLDDNIFKQLEEAIEQNE